MIWLNIHQLGLGLGQETKAPQIRWWVEKGSYTLCIHIYTHNAHYMLLYSTL